jgi:hypothetical protein
MTDAELEEFLGIARCSAADRAKVMATITPAKRAVYESMANLETEVALWQEGLGPKPEGVIICGCGRRGMHRHGRQK